MKNAKNEASKWFDARESDDNFISSWQKYAHEPSIPNCKAHLLCAAFSFISSLQSYRTTGSIRVLREEGYFSCKAFKVLGRENPAPRRNRVIFQECKNYPLLASESFRIVSNDIWRPKLSQRLEKRLAINEISRWTK